VKGESKERNLHELFHSFDFSIQTSSSLQIELVQKPLNDNIINKMTNLVFPLLLLWSMMHRIFICIHQSARARARARERAGG
jgi:hypothetical protein